MRCTNRSLACAGALAMASTPLTAQNTVAADVPIRVDRGRTLIPVTIGASDPLHLILDTGMPYDGILVFDTAGVDLTAFDQLARVQIPGAGGDGPSRGLSDAAATFSVGHAAFAGQRVTFLTEDAWRRSSSDGVIGYSLLGHYAVEIDYDRERMILYEPATFTPAEGWVSLDFAFRDNRIPWLGIAVATADEDPVQLDVYIDFASGEALELLDRERNRFTMPVLTGDTTFARGLSGEVRGMRGRVAVVRIGPFVLHDVAVNLVPAEVRSRQPAADAVIGNDALRRFNLIFDYANSKLHLRPNRYFGESFQAIDPGNAAARRHSGASTAGGPAGTPRCRPCPGASD